MCRGIKRGRRQGTGTQQPARVQRKKIQKMKVFAFALLLLVAVTYGEALQCHNCVREAPDTPDCVETVETCLPEMDTCAKITYPAPYENTFHKSCFKMSECLKLALTQGLKVHCCNWDSCNK